MKGLADLLAGRRRPRERSVRDVLTELGLTAEEIEQAEADGTDEMMALDGLVLAEPGRYALDEVVEISGLPVEAVQAIWRGFGFADVLGDDRVFVQRDLNMLMRYADAIERGVIEPEQALQVVRVLGMSLAQFATAVVDSAEERSAERRRAAAEAAEAAAESGDTGVAAGPARHDSTSIAVQAGTLLPMMTDALDYAFRRHLKNAAQYRIALTSRSGDRQAVGFADLVNFTRLVQDLDERGLGDLMDRFDAISHEVVVSHGGRVVKMIGDECMFAFLDAVDAARTSLELAGRVELDELLPGVRVGLAYGPVLQRDGDLYGQTVNLASRLVQLGAPGSVYVSREVRDAVSHDPRFTLRNAGVRRLRHIGNRRTYRMKPGPAWATTETAPADDA